MTAEEFLATYDPPVQALCVRLRTLVRSVLPDMQEIVFEGWKNLSYGTGASQADKDLICYIAPYARSANLGFYRGALLSDPHHRLTGTGKLLRHIKYARPGQIDDEVVLGFLKAARHELLGDERSNA